MEAKIKKEDIAGLSYSCLRVIKYRMMKEFVDMDIIQDLDFIDTALKK